MVAEGEGRTMDGWLRYGAALLQGRKLFPKGADALFSQWIADCNLQFEVCANDRAAAVWAATDLERFSCVRVANPKVRTVRGLHAKWKEAQAEAAKPKPRVYETPTEKDIRKAKAMRARADHPTTPEGDRAACRAKLDAYEERFGPGIGTPSYAKPKAQSSGAAGGFTEPPTDKKELSRVVTKLALKRAAKDTKTFDMIEFAIRTTYGNLPGSLEKILRNLEAA